MKTNDKILTITIREFIPTEVMELTCKVGARYKKDPLHVKDAKRFAEMNNIRVRTA